MAELLQSSGGVGRLINLIPVGLKEAAVDSPTSRATVIHYGEQIDFLERWLEDYLKSTNRVITESSLLENILNNLLSHAMLPTTISESMLDQDYSLLAIKRYSEGAKDFWMSTVSVVKRMSTQVVDPIRTFLQTELRPFKDARKAVETSQKNFDALQFKFAALGKSKEPSSLREDAFQLHEARKLYLKASMDFASIAPQFRFSLDKLLVRVFSDQWREMRISRDNTAAIFQRSSQDMDRVKGWLKEMENSERTFRRELLAARKQLEEAAEVSHRPSRELEDYSVSTIPHTHSHTASGSALQRSPKRSISRTGEKQGWLYLRTYAGKPTRTVWVKRWAFLRNGVFGWLLQGSRPGAVEESERIGVLLCNARPAATEDRRFCFELKTNRNTILLQAETQTELADWIAQFETAKSKALDQPTGMDPASADPAFAISAPPIPEFGSLVLSSTEPGAYDEPADRTGTLPLPATDASRESVDIARRSTATEDGGHRETASRIMSKLDLHRKNPASPQVSSSPSTSSLGGGIASLIAASHSALPVSPALPVISAEDQTKPKTMFTLALRDMPPSSLAPSTLANTPAPTSLSKAAIIVTGERGITATTSKSGIPNGILANTWGTSSFSYVNRLERGDPKPTADARLDQPSPMLLPSGSPSKFLAPSLPREDSQTSVPSIDLALPASESRSRTPSPGKRHRATISVGAGISRLSTTSLNLPDFPNYYPLQLKTQDAQFRLLFPNVRLEERLVIVFRATWNPNDQQEFPGRVYVTPSDIYFYSNHFGLVLTSGVSLKAVDEVTAAPGRDCDFLFMHLKEGSADSGATRITIKTFLEPLRLLQRRLNFLARNATAEQPLALEDIIKVLLKLESEVDQRSPSLESWEDVAPDTPIDSVAQRHRPRSSTVGTELRAPLRVDRALYGTSSPRSDKMTKFKLPAKPVEYTPAGNLIKAVEKEFDVSPKALFHVMFGDKSALWQLLQHEHRAHDLKQGPWLPISEGRLRRQFEFEVPSTNIFGRKTMARIDDYQFVDVNSDHLCYVVTDKRTAWHLPFANTHRLVSKIVITHVAKARCKLAIFVKVEWLKDPWTLKSALERQALHDLELDAQDLADIVADQVRKLGAHSRTRKAVQIFGQVGVSSDIMQFQIDRSALNIELRRVPVSRTVGALLLQNVGSVLESGAGSIVQMLLDVFKSLAKVISANTVILALLVLSVLFNTWYSSRSGLGWWQERNASRFMARMGVVPGQVMSKAVYVSDIDEVMSFNAVLPVIEDSPCYQLFYDQHRPDDVDAPNVSSAGINGGAMRVQQARQRLGTYRHDLLVAMRMVNSVEKEVVRSEWEEWVKAESRRCRAVDGLMGNGNATGLQVLGVGLSDEGKGQVSQWHNEYCSSCQKEYGKVLNA